MHVNVNLHQFLISSDAWSDHRWPLARQKYPTLSIVSSFSLWQEQHILIYGLWNCYCQLNSCIVTHLTFHTKSVSKRIENVCLKFELKDLPVWICWFIRLQCWREVLKNTKRISRKNSLQWQEKQSGKNGWRKYILMLTRRNNTCDIKGTALTRTINKNQRRCHNMYLKTHN